MLDFLKDEEGQGMVEYGLIIGLIAVIVIAVFIVVGPKIKTLFENTVNDSGQDRMSSAMN